MSRFSASPLTPERWDDLVTVFGGGEGRGECGRCWCMWWRLPRAGLGQQQGKRNKALFRERVDAGPPPGLIGYDEEPVAWMQIGPRADVPVWSEPNRLTAPLAAEEASDPQVWGITCFVVRTGFRRRGYAAAMLNAGIDWAVRRGARVLDACPVDTDGGRRTATALYHGVARPFAERGFVEQARRRPDRPLMRLDLRDRAAAAGDTARG